LLYFDALFEGCGMGPPTPKIIEDCDLRAIAGDVLRARLSK